MNYRVFTDTASPRFLAKFTIRPWEKPSVGDIITLDRDKARYVITKEKRNTTTPALQEFEKLITQDKRTLITQNGLVLIVNEEINTEDLDVSYDFFITQQNRTTDSVSLRRDAEFIQRRLQRFG